MGGVTTPQASTTHPTTNQRRYDDLKRVNILVNAANRAQAIHAVEESNKPYGNERDGNRYAVSGRWTGTLLDYTRTRPDLHVQRLRDVRSDEEGVKLAVECEGQPQHKPRTFQLGQYEKHCKNYPQFVRRESKSK